MSEFVHLHVHTEYSLLDGAIRIKDICQKTKELGMSSVAITDHGNMFGAVTFYQTALSFGLKPIIGCEVYIAPGDVNDAEAHTQKTERYHLILLAKNFIGYKNLIQLVTLGYLEGLYYKPRVSKYLLNKYKEGLICLSACLGGEIPKKLLSQGLEAGIQTAKEYAEIFPGDFYLELQKNGIPEQTTVNQMLKEVAQATQLPLVATNDCHYLNKGDDEAHDVLLCIQTAKKVDEQDRMRMNTDQLYFKTPEEMQRDFADCPEALENTHKIAKQCNVEIPLGNYSFPTFELPEGMTATTELERMCKEGLEQRIAKAPYTVDETVYWDRLKTELAVIKQMGFPAYFLIVQDFINWAKKQDIPVGPGRGSAAGSIVAWSLGITNLDPIPYGLLFERFLNKERVSMPDIDVDFCERRRLNVIEYCAKKYGHDHVAQITTFGRMKAKAVIRDVARALNIELSEADKISKLVPADPKMTLSKALDQEPDLLKLYQNDERIRKLIDISKRLEGLCRHASVHAAGLVFSDEPMVNYLPLYKGKKGGTVTQYDMKCVEKIGLVKFDFLGLKTATVIHDTLKIIRQQGKTPPDLHNISLADPKTYEVFSTGNTDGIFQVESSGMRQYLRMLKPHCFEDIIAMLALYRPGPLSSDMVNHFIKCKHGTIKVSYPHPCLKTILEPTYGVIVYQEQVMAVATEIANYSLGESDLLRRAMGKKNAKDMEAQEKRFLQGAKENNIPNKTALEIFKLMKKFAEYGFNKSHSAAYALISYYTAYLKAHHTIEFMAALISTELNNTAKLYMYINACQRMGITINPPNINTSVSTFSIADKTILFGLTGIKNVGEDAVHAVVAEREANGPYQGLLDFCSRVDLHKVSKRVIEFFIKGGAMDCFDCPRAALMAALEKAVAYGQNKAKEREQGMLSMLDLLAASSDADSEEPVCFSLDELNTPEWEDIEKQKMEKEALGFFLTTHPLSAFIRDMQRLRLDTLESCREYSAEIEVKIGCIVTDITEKYSRNGEKYARLAIEDLSGVGEITIWSRSYNDEIKALLTSEIPLYIEGKTESSKSDLDEGTGQARLIASSIKSLTETINNNTEPIELSIKHQLCSQEHLEALSAILLQYPGNIPVCLWVYFNEYMVQLNLGSRFKVSPKTALWEELDTWQGKNNDRID